MPRADEIYTSGPETLIAESSVIVAGPVLNLVKQITETHAPSGTPLRWEIHGEIERPETLKGDRPPSAIRFTRVEQPVFLDQQPQPPWMSDYLLWQPGDEAVIFFQPAGLQVFPSGGGERDLVALVRLVVAIQAMSKPEQRSAAWMAILNSDSSTAQAKEAAMRSLVAMRVPFDELLPTFQRVLASSERQVRGFAFGLVVFGITHQLWSEPARPAALLCRKLQAETDDNSVANYLASFSALLNFASEDDFVVARRPLREQLRRCVVEKCDHSAGETAQTCSQILGRFPQ